MQMATKKPTPAPSLVPITEGPPVDPGILDLTHPIGAGSPARYPVSPEHQEVLTNMANYVRNRLASPDLTDEQKQELLSMQALLVGRLASEQIITTLKRVNRQADKLGNPATPTKDKVLLAAAVTQAMPFNPCQVIPNPEAGGGNPAVLHQAKAFFKGADAGGEAGSIIDLPTILSGIKQSASRNDPQVVQKEMAHAIRKLEAAAQDALSAGNPEAATEIVANQARLVDVWNNSYLPVARLVGYDTANELVLNDAISTAAKDKGMSVMTFVSQLAANPDLKKVIRSILGSEASDKKGGGEKGETSRRRRWWCKHCKEYGGHSTDFCKNAKSERAEHKSKKGQ